MKKTVFILISVFVLLLSFLWIAPLFLKDKLQEIVIREANKSMNAVMSFDDLNLSFLRNFPKATLSLEDFIISGKDEFSMDTLVKADEFYLTLDALSLFGDKVPEIQELVVEKAAIRLRVLKTGQANWDIMIPDTTLKEIEQDSSDFAMKLSEIKLENCNFSYVDEESDIQFHALSLDAVAVGDFKSSVTDLKLEMSVKSMSYAYGGMTFLENVEAEASGGLKADFNKFRFTFNEDDIRLNALKTKLEGWLELPDEGFDMDLKLNASAQGLKEFLTIIPGTYQEKLKDIQSEGELKFSLGLKGKFTDVLYPGISLELNLKNGNLYTAELPGKIENINVDVNVQSKEAADFDGAIVDIKNISFQSGNNHLKLKSYLTHLTTNPAIELSAIANLNLKEITPLLPVENLENTKGLLNANLYFKGTQKELELQKFNKILARGDFNLKQFEFDSDSLKKLNIENLSLKLNPEKVNLIDFNAHYGNSDLKMYGGIDNLYSYVFAKSTLKADFNLQSNLLDMSDFSTGNSSDTSALELIEIPQNLDLKIALQAKKIKFGNINPENVDGIVKIKDGKAVLEKFKMKVFNGYIAANGYYQSKTKAENASMNFGFDIQNASYLETFRSLDVISKYAPVFEKAKGDYSMKINLSSILKQDFSPDLKTVLCEGLLKSENVSVSDIKAVQMLGSTLLKNSSSNYKLKNLNIPFKIEDGNLITKPFTLTLGSTKLQLSGLTNLEKKIDYKGTAVFSGINAFGENVNELNFRISGNFTSPKVEVDTKTLGNKLVKVAVKSTVKEVLNVKSDEELQQKISTIRTAARASADKLISQADAEAKKLEDNAKSTLAKLAAKKAAEQIKKEAQKQSEKILAEAEKKVLELTK